MPHISRAIIGIILSMTTSIAIAGDAAAGKAKSMSCAGCHGATGVSQVPIYPNLAGQKEAYLVKAIKAYKNGDRADPTMKAMVAALSDADIDNLAAYYSSQGNK
jgi:cytochrome c553